MRTAPVSAADTSLTSGHAVSWSAIFAGAFVAAGVSLILALIGAGLGLSAASPWSHPGETVAKLGVATIIWLAIIQLIASALGGYLAGRLRATWPGLHTHEVYFRDTAHGLITWAFATVAVATLMSSVMATVVGQGAKATASVADTAGNAALTSSYTAGPGHDTLDYFTGKLLRQAPGAKPAASASGQDSGEIARVFTVSIAQGGMTEEDKQYLTDLVARDTGLSQAEAQQRVSNTYAALQAKVDALKDKAKQAADDARKASAATALWFAITLLIGAFIASWAATFGGRRRDLY